MKYRPVFQLALLGLLAGLAACDDSKVDVEFAEPFPTGGADVTQWPIRQRGRYVAVGDTTKALQLAATALLQEQTWQQVAKGPWLDSVGLPRRAGEWPARGRRYRVQPLAADSFRLSFIEIDTVFAFGPGQRGQLRRYSGTYYLNDPNPDRPGSWQVQRLVVNGPRLRWQYLNPDSLRLRALNASALREQRADGRLQVTVQPHSRHTQRQVHRYAGLWLTAGEYERQPRAYRKL